MSQPQSIYDRIMSQNKTEPVSAIDKKQTQEPQKQRKTRWPLIAVAIVIAGGTLGAGALWASGNLPLDAIASTETSPPKAPPQLLESVFLSQARDAGLTRCNAVFPLLGSLLAEGTRYNVQTRLHNEKPDAHAVQALVGMTYGAEAYSGPAAGVVFAAPNGSACEGAMVRVVPFAKSCIEVEKTLPQGFAAATPLNGVGVYQLAGNGGDVMLLSSADSCVAISIVQASDVPAR